MGGAVFSVIVYALIAIFVFRKIRKLKNGQLPNHPRNGRPAGAQTAPVPVRRDPVHVSAARRKNSGVNAAMAREKIDIGSWEDRKNDWLARQMAEERIARKRVSDMFQMKMEHKYNCEAEMLKQFHEVRCNANEVDTGEHK